jgi:UTP--glucose-1-phosphate uridylyltransferase
MAYADDVFVHNPNEPPVSAQLIKAYKDYGKCGVAMKEVPTALVKKYSSLKAAKLEGNIYSVTDMIEKPTEAEMFSNFSILGRCLLDSSVFDILEHTKEGAGNEIQLTDAMKEIAQTKGMLGVDFIGTRYDAGSKIGLLKAQIEIGLRHSEIGEELREYLGSLKF